MAGVIDRSNRFTIVDVELRNYHEGGYVLTPEQLGLRSMIVGVQVVQQPPNGFILQWVGERLRVLQLAGRAAEEVDVVERKRRFGRAKGHAKASLADTPPSPLVELRGGSTAAAGTYRLAAFGS
jgi:hypothetical protein